MRRIKNILAWIVTLLALFACRSPKELHDKAIIKGYKEVTKIDTVHTSVFIKGADGKDSLIFIDVPCVCPDPQIITRWSYKVIKQEQKTERKKAVENTKVTKAEAKKDIKFKRKKGANKIIWIIALIDILILALIIYKYEKR